MRYKRQAVAEVLEDLDEVVEVIEAPVAPRAKKQRGPTAREMMDNPALLEEVMPTITSEPINLTARLSKAPTFQPFRVWIIGTSPLITHAWSQKAKEEMLGKQVKSVKAGREERDPEQDFVDSLYEMRKGVYGFPATGVKNCILSAAHKDRGIARTNVLASLWLNHEMVSVRPALAGAVCDMPLIRIWGADPKMREDMTKIGSGLNKVANLAYRAQFWPWAMLITGRFNVASLNANALAFLIQSSGMASGVGEWRNERKGMFGAFRLATEEDEKAWEAYSEGKGPLPKVVG